MRTVRAWMPVVVALVVLSMPLTTSAAGLVTCNGIDCQACSVVGLLQSLINFAIGLSIPIAMVLFAYAGVLYFTSATNAENVSKARRIFKSVFVGFVITLGGYLIIETGLHAILNPDYWSGWNKVQCVDKSQRPTDKTISDLINEAVIPAVTGNVGTTNSTTGTTQTAGYSGSCSTAASGYYCDGGARNTLENNGVLINKADCTSAGQTDCTSLDGVRQATVLKVLELSSNCSSANQGASCNLVVTAGTEAGHETGTQSHSTGYKVDLQYGTPLDSYIKTTFIQISTRSDGAQQWQDSSGAVYALELTQGTAPHWDVLVP